jgi:nicotinamide-nucleotide amidase
MGLAQTLEGPIDTLVQQVLGEACDRGLKLATAESCTGGLLASVLTDVKGMSHAFERGFVTYTNEAKAELLGVPLDLIEEHDAVSEPVAKAMAEGAIAHSKADVAVAVTGFADGAGPESKPGLVYLAVARKGRPTKVIREEFGPLGRERVRERAVASGLELFRSEIV